MPNGCIFAAMINRTKYILMSKFSKNIYDHSVATKINKIQRNVVVIKWLMKKSEVKWGKRNCTGKSSSRRKRKNTVSTKT